ncbi:hypothetical protein OsJ_15855 [Oryza sativa Japonica Group]|uniref:Uncharacterized protein n=1 Tax=Oryza sativa subsp. japonica TaxID=39947 RepID=B9FC32_ORYSJ|nr:hypothetical protein OsJ_15855 [Oryza sativa Japonica Group]
MGWSLERNIPLRSGTKRSAKIGQTNPSHFDGENGVSSRSLLLGSAAVPPWPPVPSPPAPFLSAAPSSSACSLDLRDRHCLVRVRPPPPRPAVASSATASATDRRRSSSAPEASRSAPPRRRHGRPPVPPPPAPTPGAAPSSSACSLYLRDCRRQIRDGCRLVRIRLRDRPSSRPRSTVVARPRLVASGTGCRSSMPRIASSTTGCRHSVRASPRLRDRRRLVRIRLRDWPLLLVHASSPPGPAAARLRLASPRP